MADGTASPPPSGERQGRPHEKQSAGAPNASANERSEAPPRSPSPYSIYTSRQKNFMVFMSCIGGLFSPFSSSSILPALEILATDYATSISVINLSVTVFMIIQGLSPSMIGDLADLSGRRPAYLVSFLFIVGANVGLALQSNLVAFMILRCLQSVGSSGMYSLNSGVVADISTSAERGKYMGAAQSGIMFRVILTIRSRGWWYLNPISRLAFHLLAAGIYLVVFATFIPETNRRIVGNGSLPPVEWFNRSILNELARRRELRKLSGDVRGDKLLEAQKLAENRKLRFPNPFKTFRILLEKDCACIMFTTAIVYASWYTVTTTLATYMKLIHGLNTIDAGLCYLPFGTGAALAVFFNGRMLDWNFKRIAHREGLPVERTKGQDLATFPIERARLDLVWPQLYVGCAALIGYGWTLQAEAHLAATLVLTFLIGVFMTTTYNSLNILLVDLYPHSPSTASAANNLTRCMMGAGGAAVIEPLINRLGAGWAFTFVGLVVVLVSPMLYIVRRWGPVWREQRRVRTEPRKEPKATA